MKGSEQSSAPDAACALKPDGDKAYSGMGLAYVAMEQHADGLAVCKKVIALNPNSAMAHFSMGLAYADLKQYMLAITALEKAVALDPKGKMADLSRKLIRGIREQ